MNFVYKSLAAYFEGTGLLSQRLALNDDFAAEFDEVFLPFIRSLDAEQQVQFIRLLTQIALGYASEFSQWRWQALRLLERLKYPWPHDHRSLLLNIKEDLVQEFNEYENLHAWASAKDQRGWLEAGQGPGYALVLYGLILIVGADTEVAESVEYLLNNAGHPRFRKAVQRLPELLQGIELTASPPLTREQYMEYRRRLSSAQRDV